MYSDDQMLFGKTDYVDNTNFVRGNIFSYPNHNKISSDVFKQKYLKKNKKMYLDKENRFYPNNLNKNNKYYKVYPDLNHYLSNYPKFQISELFTNQDDYYYNYFLKYILYVPLTIIILIFLICSPLSSISFIPAYKTNINSRKLPMLKLRKSQNSRSNLMTLSILMFVLCILYLVFRMVFDKLFTTYPKCKGINEIYENECNLNSDEHKLYNNCKECLDKNEILGGTSIDKCSFDDKTDKSSCNDFENSNMNYKNYFVENYIIFFLMSIFLYLYLSMSYGKSNKTIYFFTCFISICVMVHSIYINNYEMHKYEILIYVSYLLFYTLTFLLFHSNNKNLFGIVKE